MTKEENVFLAKKLFAELVHNTAYIEGVNTTFPQTQTIIDGGIVNNVSVDDIQTVLNLRDAWRFALKNVDAPLTSAYICKVNEYVSRNESLQWGVLRTGNVAISGTNFRPKPPTEKALAEKLQEIDRIDDPKEKALEYFCYSVRSQLFWDGNKRTSTIVASKMLIEKGQGVLTIDKKNAQAFNEALLCYYSTNEKGQLIATLKNCIKTI